MAKSIIWLAAIIISGALGVQLYRLYSNNAAFEAELKQLSTESEQLSSENASLQADISYFAEPENLAKELKSKFDYKKPGEKLIKINE